MLTHTQIQAQYEAEKVQGRSNLDPRKGIYKIISVYQGTCFGKPATMATAEWKVAIDDQYTDQIFTVQLESLKTVIDPINTDEIVGREIHISSANWYPTARTFAISWKILPSQLSLIDKLNELLKSGVEISIDNDDDLLCDDFANMEEEY